MPRSIAGGVKGRRSNEDKGLARPFLRLAHALIHLYGAGLVAAAAGASVAHRGGAVGAPALGVGGGGTGKCRHFQLVRSRCRWTNFSLAAFYSCNGETTNICVVSMNLIHMKSEIMKLEKKITKKG